MPSLILPGMSRATGESLHNFPLLGERVSGLAAVPEKQSSIEKRGIIASFKGANGQAGKLAEARDLVA